MYVNTESCFLRWDNIIKFMFWLIAFWIALKNKPSVGLDSLFTLFGRYISVVQFRKRVKKALE